MLPLEFSYPIVMDIYDVREMFSRYYVDPKIATKNVPSKWKIKIHENGKALLLVMVQDCKKMVLEHLFNIGSVRMAHIWIELDGPLETIDTLPGTSRTLPSWYWYIQPHQLDNRLAYFMFKMAGVSAQFVQKISLGGECGGRRSGAVLENTSPDVEYHWTETSQLFPEPDIITGSHRFYRNYGWRESEAHASCFTHFLGDAHVELEAIPSSTVGRLGFGSQLTGFSNPVWVKHCRVEYRVKWRRRV